MKIILTRDVKDTGRMNEVVEVADGHALNFLIPQGMAISATEGALKSAATRQKAVIDRKALDVKLVEERLAALADGKLVITKKANEQGHLYDAVDAAEIAEAANLPEDVVKLNKPLKEVGEHEVAVAIGEAFGKVTVTIEAE